MCDTLFAVYVNEYQFKYAIDEYDEVLNIEYIPNVRHII